MKALVVDDHALVRDALARVLTGLVPDTTVLEAGDPETAFQVIERSPDLELVLLDLSLPGMHGMTVLQTLRAKHPSIPVVVVSASSDRESVEEVLESGAMGFIPKSSSNDVMRSALGLVLAGGVYVPSELIGRGSPLPMASPQPDRTDASEIGLTERQAQILFLMMEGESNKRICRELGIAESTVKNQISAILKALGATNRTQAVLAAGKLRLAPSRLRRSTSSAPRR